MAIGFYHLLYNVSRQVCFFVCQRSLNLFLVTLYSQLQIDPVSKKSVKVYNEIPQLVEYPTKNSDRNKALELLGKRYSMWTDKQDITQKTIEIKVGEWDADEE